MMKTTKTVKPRLYHSIDQWEQRNAEVLNQDDYGFGLEEVPDMDDQLFAESGLQPDEYGAIPWDAVVP
eukprot:5825472-Amphidinium_carterae.1